jgi:uncharacterized membrane protein YccF (DUF307 family)
LETRETWNDRKEREMAVTGELQVVGTRHEQQFPFVLRALWFVFIGWHVSLWWVLASWFFIITIIGLPLGLWMLNRTPLVLTLRMTRGYTAVTLQDGQVVQAYQGAPQRPWLVRLFYFVVIGWWFSLLWSLAGWALCVSIVGLPLGVLMLNRLPNVTTWMRQ